MNSAIRRSDYRGGRAEENRRRSPVSTPAASPKAALHACAAEGGGSFAAPLGHALSDEKTVNDLMFQAWHIV